VQVGGQARIGDDVATADAGLAPAAGDEGKSSRPPDEGESSRLPAVMWALVVTVAASPTLLGDVFTSAALENWATVFLSLTLQALPFLVLGVIVSAVISAFVPAGWLARALPRRPAVAVPVAGLAGAMLPGCECSSVPVAGRLVDKGAPPAAALTFLLAAPAINPVVMVSTAVAFPGRPEVVVARFGASLATAVVVGIVWSRFASTTWLERRLAEQAGHSHGRTFVDTAVADMLQAGGFLVMGAALVATMHTVIPRSAFDTFAGGGVGPILVLAALAVVLSICSEADAFVAAGLTQFSMTSRLVFLVVGPMVDLKLIALHVGTFGGRFALRFDPLVVVVAIVVGSVVGSVVL
jgi:uncharacterized membrane protein YraQ (UPF0718 family)